jgi:hypothetical protein
MMLGNVKDLFVKGVLLSSTIDRTNLSLTLDKVGRYCEEDLKNTDLPFEVVDKRAELWFKANEAYMNGEYGLCRSHLVNYFLV